MGITVALVFKANVLMSWSGWENESATRPLKDSGAASTRFISMSAASASRKTSFNALVSSCINGQVIHVSMSRMITDLIQLEEEDHLRRQTNNRHLHQ